MSSLNPIMHDYMHAISSLYFLQVGHNEYLGC